MSRRTNLYFGQAGEFAVMSELLTRGWNVAIPQVDVGDDVIVIDDHAGNFIRVQIKSANATQRASSHTVRFRFPLKQLLTPTDPELIYILAVRNQGKWQDFLIIPRTRLYNDYSQQPFGSVSNDALLLYLSFENKRIICSGRDVSTYCNDWSQFPEIKH